MPDGAGQQQDLICTACPLRRCDEESLWCAYRWATNPNAAQLNVASVRLIPRRLTAAERARKYRQRNRERYNAIKRDSRARKKANDPQGYAEHLKKRRMRRRAAEN